jgi:hypothetical protein
MKKTMADVGGALLSVVFDDLLKKMTLEVLDFFGGRKLADRPLGKLKIRLLSLKSVVEDAEDKELTKPAVKEWLDELKDALYDAEDILDEIHTEIRTRKLAAESQTIATKVRNSVSNSFNPFFKQMKPKIDEVLTDSNI